MRRRSREILSRAMERVAAEREVKDDIADEGEYRALQALARGEKRAIAELYVGASLAEIERAAERRVLSARISASAEPLPTATVYNSSKAVH